MLEIEVFGASLAPGAPAPREIRRLCTLAAEHAGVQHGHVAIEFVRERRIAQLNAEYRQTPGPTDVLSFPIDGVDAAPGTLALAGAGPQTAPSRPGAVPRELGDIVICPQHTADIREAVVHGMLHLLGMDHERDDGEMLALQRELLAEASG
jgi:probable rRNA maturation factor